MAICFMIWIELILYKGNQITDESVIISQKTCTFVSNWGKTATLAYADANYRELIANYHKLLSNQDRIIFEKFMLISTICVKRSVCNIVIRAKALFGNFAFLCLIGGKMQFFILF